MNYETKRWLPLRNILSLGSLLTNISGAVCTGGGSHTMSPMLLRLFSAEHFSPWAFTTSHGRKTCHNAPDLQFLVWSSFPAVLPSPWPCSGGNGRIRLALKLRTWPLLVVYQMNFLPSERFLYISEVEGQLDLGKYCLSLKQLVG